LGNSLLKKSSWEARSPSPSVEGVVVMIAARQIGSVALKKVMVFSDAGTSKDECSVDVNGD
jgi:hypothetical protein